MQSFNLSRVLTETCASGAKWREFLRVSALSMGVYFLKVGDLDSQLPHSEDEAYYILRGKSSFRAGEQVIDVSAGQVIFVEKHLDHRFFDITEDLEILVFFAPAEGSLRQVD